MSMLSAALRYAARGLPVFPLKPRGKEPSTEHGFKDATTDERRIRRWWTKSPNANIGIPTGEVSGWVVLDVDPRHQGDAKLEALIAKHGRLPDTLQQQTGRGDGGRHYVFRWQPDIKTWNSDGLELLSDGRYVVGSPSVHPDSGKPYRWDGLDPARDLANLAELPVWLRQAPDAAKKTGKMKEPNARIPAGKRNSHLTSLAGTMRRRGMTPDAILAALLEENRLRCEPPLEPKEVETIARSVGRYAPGERTGGTAPNPVGANGAASGDFLNFINSSEVFSATEGFQSFQMRGRKVLGTTRSGSCAVFATLSDLYSFTRARPILSRALRAYLPGIGKSKVYEVWEPLVRGILEIATMNSSPLIDDTQAEMQAALAQAFISAGSLNLAEREEFKKTLAEAREYRRVMTIYEWQKVREARIEKVVITAPPAVFVYRELVWVHLPCLRGWLSTPAGENRLWRVGDMHDGLYALGFLPSEARFRYNGATLKMDLWAGPLSALEEELDLKAVHWQPHEDLRDAIERALASQTGPHYA